MDMVTAILATDGRHVLLGRNSEPSDAEVASAGAAIAAHGLRAWLVRLHGNRWTKCGPGPQIEVVAPIHEDLTTDDLEAATSAFRRMHKERLGVL